MSWFNEELCCNWPWTCWPCSPIRSGIYCSWSWQHRLEGGCNDMLACPCSSLTATLLNSWGHWLDIIYIHSKAFFHPLTGKLFELIFYIRGHFNRNCNVLSFCLVFVCFCTFIIFYHLVYFWCSSFPDSVSHYALVFPSHVSVFLCYLNPSTLESV